MSAETLERSVLEGKDRDQLIAIASALGIRSLSRAKKAEIIDRILEHTGAGPTPLVTAGANANGNGNGQGPVADAVDEIDGGLPAHSDESDPGDALDGGPAAEAPAPPVLVDEYGEPLADWEIELRLAEAAAAASGSEPGQDDATPESSTSSSLAVAADEAGDEDAAGRTSLQRGSGR